MTETAITQTFTVEAGWLVRGKLNNEIKQCAWSLGLDISSERAGSVTHFKVTGNAAKVKILLKALQKTVDNCNQ